MSKNSDQAAICQIHSSLTNINLKNKGSNFMHSTLNDILYKIHAIYFKWHTVSSELILMLYFDKLLVYFEIGAGTTS